MARIFVTRKIPENGIVMLKDAGYDVDVSSVDRVLSKKELMNALKKKPYDAVLCLLTDTIDGDVFDAVPTAKIFSNYAVGFNNISIDDAKKRGITITNTPGVLTDSVAEHTFALILALAHRIPESDQFTRTGKYKGWGPLLLLGTDIRGKTLGLLGAGRIGSRVAEQAVQGFNMKVIYYDVKQSEDIEKATGAVFKASVDDVLREADFVSIHVPLLDSTHHLMNKEKLSIMKKSAYLVNTSRGPVIDEKALVEVLEKGGIAGAGLDVYENEPALTKGLTKLPNVILTPHTASATVGAREGMARLASQAIIDFLSGKEPLNKVS